MRGTCFMYLFRCLLYSPVTDSGQIVPTDDQLSAVFEKDLVMNVFRDGAFGSFRHLLLQSGCSSVFVYHHRLFRRCIKGHVLFFDPPYSPPESSISALLTCFQLSSIMR